MWPADLVHYMEPHQVRLPEAFEAHIVNQGFKPPARVDRDWTAA